MKFDIVYSERQVADTGIQSDVEVESPSAKKPRELFRALMASYGDRINVIAPIPVTRDEIKSCHLPKYVDDVLDLKAKNGFGTISQSVADSLPYTIGAMCVAAERAYDTKLPVAALVSGFHHAKYDGLASNAHFCTFNGLMIAAMRFVKRGLKVAIIDCDHHYGDGTDDILGRLGYPSILHVTFGRFFGVPVDEQTEARERAYLSYMAKGGHLEKHLQAFKPDIILYQAGADVHIDDPYGGVLTTEGMVERDCRMFEIAKRLGVGIAWDLAGGYQVDANGSLDKVIDLHLNTFAAWEFVYGSQA